MRYVIKFADDQYVGPNFSRKTKKQREALRYSRKESAIAAVGIHAAAARVVRLVPPAWIALTPDSGVLLGFSKIEADKLFDKKKNPGVVLRKYVPAKAARKSAKASAEMARFDRQFAVFAREKGLCDSDAKAMRPWCEPGKGRINGLPFDVWLTDACRTWSRGQPSTHWKDQEAFTRWLENGRTAYTTPIPMSVDGVCGLPYFDRRFSVYARVFGLGRDQASALRAASRPTPENASAPGTVFSLWVHGVYMAWCRDTQRDPAETMNSTLAAASFTDWLERQWPLRTVTGGD